jgi:hypothetical protein
MKWMMKRGTGNVGLEALGKAKCKRHSSSNKGYVNLMYSRESMR